MVHERMRHSASGGARHPRRQQAVRTTARRGRSSVRAFHALAAALIVSSVALMGQVARAEGGQAAPDAALDHVSAPTWETDGHRELPFEPAAPVRQGGDLTDATSSPAERSAATRPSAPARPTAWYYLAATEYGVSVQLLEALHQVESNASPDNCIPNLEGSGATGPFQFKPATFAQFGVDANHDGVKDICGFADSLFSAARYLRVIGADDDPTSETTRRALTRYGTDPERVISLARAYHQRDGLLAHAPSTTRQ